MKFKEANHDEPPQCTSLIGAGMSHAFRPVHLKKNEKITRENPVKNREKDADFEPDGQEEDIRM